VVTPASGPLRIGTGTFKYSDLGYIMLTQALARSAERPFADLVRQDVLGRVEATTCDFGPRRGS